MAGLRVTSACSPILGLITGNDHQGFTTCYYYYPWFVAWKLSLEKVNDLAQILRAGQLLWAPPPPRTLPGVWENRPLESRLGGGKG